MNKNNIISTITKNKYIHFYKKIFYKKNKYKKIEYFYDIYDIDGKKTETKRHNSKGKPSVIIYMKTKIIKLEYWYKGNRHRNGAPSIIELDGKTIVSESWYNNGIKLTEDEVKKEKKVIDRRKKVLKIMIRTLKNKNN